MEEERTAFMLRVIHNQIKDIIHKSSPRFETGPKTQLQGGILGYLYHNSDRPVYQRDLEKEFRISRATATNTLQVMERNGLVVRQAMDKDARLKRIRLTSEAYANHRQIEEHMEMMERRMQQGMSQAEVSELHRMLGVLLKNLEEFAAELGESAEKSLEESREEEEMREESTELAEESGEYEESEGEPTEESGEDEEKRTERKCREDAQDTGSTD